MTLPSQFIGVDLGGSSVKAVVVGPRAELIAHANIPFIDRNREWAKAVKELVASLEHDFGRAQAVGLSAPGLANRNERCIAHLPGRLIGLEGLDWTQYLERPLLVPVLNDAHAALLGEAWNGAAVGLRNVVLYTLGTGVGGAAMVDGRLLRGHLGRGGHFGHVTVDFLGQLDDVRTPGSLEMELGNRSLARRSNGRFSTTHTLVAACQQGDPMAMAIWRRSLKAFAAAIASTINVLDPEAVIVGGGISHAGPVLFGPLQAELDQFEWRPGGAKVRLLPAELGDLAGAYGAASQAVIRWLEAHDAATTQLILGEGVAAP
ncbi:MAG TPA: ROK family protein [Candidatus Limnocylindria bacterium]|nr:ROK family protein [Candidatus Limnocylindria bacterium]